MNRVVKMASGLALAITGSLAVQAQEADLQVRAVDRGAGYFASEAPIEPPFNSDSAVVRSAVIHEIEEDTAAIYGVSEPQPYWGYGGWFRGGYTGVEGWAVVPGAGERFGVVGVGEGSPANYGVWGDADGQSNGVAYGVLGEASCPAGATNCISYGVYADGNLAYTGDLIGPISDLRFKEAVEPLESVLASVLELQVVSYEHRRDAEIEHLGLPGGKQYGFVAQQVAEVLPDLVVDALVPAQGSRNGEKDYSPPIPYKALKITELLPFLVRAIQEQQAEIESLKAQIEPLRHRLADREETGPETPAACR
jgi:hypothetical protein